MARKPRWYEKLLKFSRRRRATSSRYTRAANKPCALYSDSDCVKLSKDAETFAFRHKKLLERAPLQVYGTALVLSPTTNGIRNHYWDDRLPSIIGVQANIGDNWDTEFETIGWNISRVDVVAFSPDGKMLASGLNDKTVRLWDTETGVRKQTLKAHTDKIGAVAPSPDNKMLASGSWDKTVHLWNTQNGTHIRTLEGPGHTVPSIVFSPNGKILAFSSYEIPSPPWDIGTGTHESTVWLWDTGTGTHRQTLKGHTDFITAVAFSSDNRMLASSSEDNTLRLWDVETGTHVQTLEGDTDFVTAVAFSSDNRIFASAWSDNKVRLWGAGISTHQQALKKDSRYQDRLAALFSNSEGSRNPAFSELSSKTNCVRSIPVGGRIEALSFTADYRLLITDMGVICLDDILQPPVIAPSTTSPRSEPPAENIGYLLGYEIYELGDRITRHGKRILYLADEYAPCCLTFSHSTVAVGTETGKVIILKFASE
ncbi:WD40-repeat-containing domain protein [Nemania abortiva]|nr:WD40-repeat-containing domain protein [Nemania abortiva]